MFHFVLFSDNQLNPQAQCKKINRSHFKRMYIHAVFGFEFKTFHLVD